MARNFTTAFQSLSKIFTGNWQSPNDILSTPADTNVSPEDVVFKTNDPVEYQQKMLELQQNKYLQNRWKRVNQNLTMSAFAGLSNIKLMYRDADLMDAYPEIGAALDMLSEEATLTTGSEEGMIINVSSSSDRIKSILEDLFVNRLNMQITAQMVMRDMVKYGNEYMLLDIDRKQGIKGWRRLPVGEVERIENGIVNPYGAPTIATDTSKDDMTTKFIWTNELGNSMIPFRNWQIAHFRLLHNSIFLPYGCSALLAARRHFRMLALMEDMMLIYRLERSMERRVYKIYVGALDDADIPAFVEKIADQFKRTPIVDPLTGQLDLRKNILSASEDIFIPVRDPNAPTPIDTLAGAKNLDAIDDIKYIQKKVCAALRIPQSFLNFEEQKGDGKNLALMDVRFARSINKFQQAFLMELTKIATIHLYLLGFEDDLTNFTLTMNNPSTQAEQLEIENLQKKVTAVRDAVSDPGGGIPVMSLQRALKTILKWSEKDIKDNFEEIRLEKALSAELEKTSEIIKRTGIFDSVDRIYGEPNAQYQENQGGQEGMDGMGGAPGGGGGFGGGIDDFGTPGAEDADVMGEEGMEPTADMEGGDNANADNSQPTQPMESVPNKKPLLKEAKLRRGEQILFEKLMKTIDNKAKKPQKRVDVYDKTLMVNEEIDKMIDMLDDYTKKGEKETEN